MLKKKRKEKETKNLFKCSINYRIVRFNKNYIGERKKKQQKKQNKTKKNPPMSRVGGILLVKSIKKSNGCLITFP